MKLFLKLLTTELRLKLELKCVTLKTLTFNNLQFFSGNNTVELGIDLSEFYMSVEWDILEVPAVR